MARLVFSILLLLSSQGYGEVTASGTDTGSIVSTTDHDTFRERVPTALSEPAFKRLQQAVDRLIELAAHHQDLGFYSLAREKLIEAQTGMHRLYGVNTLEQLPLLDQLIATHIADGQFTEADRIQHFRFELLSRHHNSDSDVMLKASYRLAKWHIFRGRHTDAVFTLEEGLQTLEGMLAKNNSQALRHKLLEFERAADEASMLMFEDWDQTASR